MMLRKLPLSLFLVQLLVVVAVFSLRPFLALVSPVLEHWMAIETILVLYIRLWLMSLERIGVALLLVYAVLDVALSHVAKSRDLRNMHMQLMLLVYNIFLILLMLGVAWVKVFVI